MPSKVRISHWRFGAKKVSATKELQRSTTLGLAGAKKVVDDVLDGGSVDVVPISPVEPEALADRLTKHGFVSTVVSDGGENGYPRSRAVWRP